VAMRVSIAPVLPTLSIVSYCYFSYSRTFLAGLVFAFWWHWRSNPLMPPVLLADSDTKDIQINVLWVEQKYHAFNSVFSKFLHVFGSTGVSTQGFLLARQMLPLEPSLQPLSFSKRRNCLFWERPLINCFGWTEKP
jgi:hypothetical protein